MIRYVLYMLCVNSLTFFFGELASLGMALTLVRGLLAPAFNATACTNFVYNKDRPAGNRAHLA